MPWELSEDQTEPHVLIMLTPMWVLVYQGKGWLEENNLTVLSGFPWVATHMLLVRIIEYDRSTDFRFRHTCLMGILGISNEITHTKYLVMCLYQ